MKGSRVQVSDSARRSESAQRRRYGRQKAAARDCMRLFSLRTVRREAIFGSSKAPLRQAEETKAPKAVKSRIRLDDPKAPKGAGTEWQKAAARDCMRLFSLRAVRREAIFGSSKAPLRQAEETKAPCDKRSSLGLRQKKPHSPTRECGRISSQPILMPTPTLSCAVRFSPPEPCRSRSRNPKARSCS